MTSKGYFALAPAQTEAGDLICFLLGGSAPIVVRSRVGFYTVIGECYIHRMMDGEAMEVHSSKELREFKLR